MECQSSMMEGEDDEPCSESGSSYTHICFMNLKSKELVLKEGKLLNNEIYNTKIAKGEETCALVLVSLCFKRRRIQITV